jgi:HK97 family phage major capsid protein
MNDRHKDLMEKAMQCIHLARTIKERYSNPSETPADAAEQIAKLTKEASRLRRLAALEQEQADLETWAAQPDEVHAGLSMEASAAVKATEGKPSFPEVSDQVAKTRFFKALRNGIDSLDAIEKADLVEDAGGGELLVPQAITGPIFKDLPRIAVFRSAGPGRQPVTSDRLDVRSMTGATAGWGKIAVNATTAPDVNVAAAGPDTIYVEDLYGLSKVDEDLLADTDANVEAAIRSVVTQTMAQMEDDAFSSGAGHGSSQPWGLQNRATAITQAVTAATVNTYTANELTSLQFRVPVRHRNNGAYHAAAAATEAAMLLQDTNGQYYWQPSVQAGQPDVFRGKRWYTFEGFTANAAGTANEVIFGDLENGYLVVDRETLTVLRLNEVYREEGKIGLRFKLRSGGDLIRPNAFAKYLV